MFKGKDIVRFKLAYLPSVLLAGSFGWRACDEKEELCCQCFHIFKSHFLTILSHGGLLK